MFVCWIRNLVLFLSWRWFKNKSGLTRIEIIVNHTVNNKHVRLHPKFLLMTSFYLARILHHWAYRHHLTGSLFA